MSRKLGFGKGPIHLTNDRQLGEGEGGEVVDVPHNNNNRSIYKDWNMQETDRQNEAEVGRECCGVWEAQFRIGSTICCLLGL